MNDPTSATTHRLYTKQIRVPGSSIVLQTYLLFDHESWSLTQFGDQTEIGVRFRKRLGVILGGHGIRTLIAPTPGFNTLIASPGPTNYDLGSLETITLQPVMLEGSEDIRVYRNTHEPADTTWLDASGVAYGFSGGGCAQFYLYLKRRLWAGHGGLRSMLDYARVRTRGEQRERKYENVLEAIFDYVKPTDREIRNAHLWVLWSISSQDLGYPLDDLVHAEFNNALRAYAENHWHPAFPRCVRVRDNKVHSDIPRMFVSAGIRLGMRLHNIHIDDDSYLPENVPHTQTEGPEKNIRYLAFGVRRS